MYEGGGGGGGLGLSWNTMARAADNPMIIFQARGRNLNKTCPLLQASLLNWTFVVCKNESNAMGIVIVKVQEVEFY